MLPGDAVLAGAWGSLPNASRMLAEFFALVGPRPLSLVGCQWGPQVACKPLTAWQLTFSKPEGECPFSLLIIVQYHCRSDGPFVFVICQQSDRPLPSQAPATLEGREFLQGVCTSRWESWGGVIIESAYYCLNANQQRK